MEYYIRWRRIIPHEERVLKEKGNKKKEKRETPFPVLFADLKWSKVCDLLF
jgi:hypothetical protein